MSALRHLTGAKALVIGIDGLRWDRVKAAQAPCLTALAGGGQVCVSTLDEEDYGAVTLSGPGWSSIATGVWPAKHGVRDNTFVGDRYAEFPDFLTLVKRANPALYTVAALDWPPLAEQGTFGAGVDVRLVEDGETDGYRVADGRIASAASSLLCGHDPDAAFVYLGCVDLAGHRYGAASAEYLDAIGAVDAGVGALLAAVTARPSYPDESWLVVVATDHGHTDVGGHGGFTDAERQTLIIVAMLEGSRAVRTGARIVDVAPTVLDHLGVAAPAWFDGVSVLS